MHGRLRITLIASSCANCKFTCLPTNTILKSYKPVSWAESKTYIRSISAKYLHWLVCFPVLGRWTRRWEGFSVRRSVKGKVICVRNCNGEISLSLVLRQAWHGQSSQLCQAESHNFRATFNPTYLNAAVLTKLLNHLN